MLNADSTGERNKTLDIIKGCAIIGVIYTHMMETNDVYAGDVSYIKTIALSGLIMFFMISGYCYKPRGFKNNTLRRLKQLLPVIVICTMVLTVIMAFLQTFYGYDVTVDGVIYTIWHTLTGNGALSSYDEFLPGLSSYEVTHHYYFLWSTLGGLVIFYAIADRTRESRKNAILAVVILIVMAFLLREFIPFRLPFCLQHAPLAAAFMVIGLYIKDSGLLTYIESGYKQPKYWCILGLVIIVDLVVITYFGGEFHFMNSNYGEYGGYSIFSFSALMLLSSYILAVVIALVAKIPRFSDMLAYIGKHTLGMFLIHMFIGKLIVMQFYTLYATDYRMPYSTATEALVMTVVVTVLSLLATYVFGISMKRMEERKGLGKDVPISKE